MKMWDVLKKHPQMISVVTIFLQPEATHEEIAFAGNKLFVAMHGGGVQALFILFVTISSSDELLAPKSNWLIFLQLQRLQLNMHIEHITILPSLDVVGGRHRSN
ncbi:hypothetical protein EVAR_47745_1 [Eumeta japonica]|uniref:Uncharacterized protein n=1 Tax=Eumeta variegata TaxID=151549 RepID=A0A4C1VV73_EUMVA|nr:hypothetical protein EVAR_47745_1 [Eumeta japonica]